MIGEILLAHLVGDYLLQSTWMAHKKTQQWFAALVHGTFYTLPFLFVTQNIWALLIIGGTHAIIDRYRLARHFVWLRNRLLGSWSLSWTEAKANDGHAKEVPSWLATFLLFASDNTLHIIINVGAVLAFPG